MPDLPASLIDAQQRTILRERFIAQHGGIRQAIARAERNAEVAEARGERATAKAWEAVVDDLLEHPRILAEQADKDLHLKGRKI